MAYDDIDWNQANQLLQQQQAMQQQGQQQQQPSNTWQQALDTIQRYQQSQAGSLPQRQMPAAEAAPEKNDSKTYWAMALSLLGNRGRDLGGILQASADDYNKRLAGWEQRNSPDAKLERETKLAQLQQLDRAPQQQTIQQALQVGGLMQGDQRMAQDSSQFQSTQSQQRLLAQAKNVFDENMAKFHEQGLDERQASQLANEKQIAFLSQNGMNSRQAQNIQAENDRSNAQIQAQKDIEAQRVAGQLAVKGLEQQGKGALPPGVVAIDPDRYRSLSPGEKEKMDGILTDSRAANIALTRIGELAKAPATDANRREFDSVINNLIGDQSKEGSTGVLSNPEYIRYIKNLPTYDELHSKLGTVGQVHDIRSAIDVVRGRNPAAESIGQLQTQLQRSTNEKLRTFAVKDTYDTPQPTPAQSVNGVVKPAPGGVQDPMRAPFDPKALNMKGVWQSASAPASAPAPAPAAAPAPVQQQQDPAADAMPQQAPNTQPAPGVQLPPLRNPQGQVVQPVSMQDYQQRLASGWFPIGHI